MGNASFNPQKPWWIRFYYPSFTGEKSVKWQERWYAPSLLLEPTVLTNNPPTSWHARCFHISCVKTEAKLEHRDCKVRRWDSLLGKNGINFKGTWILEITESNIVEQAEQTQLSILYLPLTSYGTKSVVTSLSLSFNWICQWQFWKVAVRVRWIKVYTCLQSRSQ
jgi:hypothetical protein